MNDVALVPSDLPALERRTYILEVCSSLLGLVDEMVEDHQGSERLRLLGVRLKVEHLRQTVFDCSTDADFDRVEAELTKLCDDIADDLDDRNKPN